MSILVSANQLRKSFGARPLFDGLSFVIESGERVGLIGPNGAGKSTLLRILASQIPADEGQISFQKGLKVGFLEQTPALDPHNTVEATVLSGTTDPHDWENIALAHELLSKLSLDGEEVSPQAPVGKLSGGWKKRVALARELARRPDVLLLDEPTNHLDIESILWLESFLAKASFATLTITHDRLFLQRIANRILELDRRNPGGLLHVRGDYATYLETKEQLMATQLQHETVMRNTLRRETEWLRRGPKARTTKQQARIQRAETLKDEVSELEFRNQTKTARLDFQAAERAPNRLLEARKISKSYGERKLFTETDLFLGPGSRIGLLGANGCGKSTLIRVLVGNEPPDTGTLLKAEGLSIVYFEQNRETLDPKLTVAQTVASKGEHVNYQGRFIHVRSYLDRFLFRTEQVDMAVARLSGGEQSRLCLAKLMLEKADVLILDEPTNDLDVATLDVLEECLAEFPGAVILVSHDRYFLDHVANQILAFPPKWEKQKKLVAFADLAQWENWHEQEEAEKKKKLVSENAAKRAEPEAGASSKKRKLSFKEQREWDSMEADIHEAEAAIARLTEESHHPENASRASRLEEIFQELSEKQGKLDRLYERWAELEAIKGE